MPLQRYGVLNGRVIAARRETEEDSPHYQLHVVAGNTHFRIAVNVRSRAGASELLFLVDDDLRHPITARLSDLPEGFTPLRGPAGGLDFVRGKLFDRRRMRLLPSHLPGRDNDLGDRLTHFAERAMNEPEARIYAFGDRWGPELGRADPIFRFRPGNGMHDIHMNQGNARAYRHDDGVWQDGALLIHFSAVRRWVGIFLAFQSQAWHTDHVSGHTIAEPARR